MMRQIKFRKIALTHNRHSMITHQTLPCPSLHYGHLKVGSIAEVVVFQGLSFSYRQSIKYFTILFWKSLMYADITMYSNPLSRMVLQHFQYPQPAFNQI